ncbi:MAG TPA: 50S ribosomal protein L3, partial [Candidatus Veblenbacteria bacterium]|nr:50S ribosomal protein L3 [Candidatus Veblenbacteria bacterium]HCX39339.1 50S ribosomal protein L3 [Candidatus Veblenbacteria bacterium]
GRMGDAQVTISNLRVVEIRPETNELVVKGAVPGARHGLLLIKSVAD